MLFRSAPVELSDPSAFALSGEGIAGYGIRLPNLPNLPNLPDLPNANFSNVATDLLDAADKHVPTLSVNARRKFFHALAVVMFVPGIAVDVSTLLSASFESAARSCYDLTGCSGLMLSLLHCRLRLHTSRSAAPLRCSPSRNTCGTSPYIPLELPSICS